MNFLTSFKFVCTFFVLTLSIQDALSQEIGFGPVDTRNIQVKKKSRNAPNQIPDTRRSGPMGGGASSRDACIRNIPSSALISKNPYSIQHLVSSKKGHDLGGLISNQTKYLWFYSPYDLNEISPIEFGLISGQGESSTVVTLYLSNKQIRPGILGLPIEQFNVELEKDQPYYWYATVYCDDPKRNNVPDHLSYAWLMSSIQEEWPDTLFWYDDLEKELYENSPQSIRFKQDGNKVNALYISIDSLKIADPQICELLRFDFDIDCN